MKLFILTLSLCFASSSAFAKLHFGKENINKDLKNLNLQTLINNFDQYKSKPVLLKATVKKVCQAKGCWAQVEDENGLSVRAIMKGHGFSLPKEIIGKTVFLEGKMEQPILKAATIRHYMKDDGQPEEVISKITKDAKVFQFTANEVFDLKNEKL